MFQIQINDLQLWKTLSSFRFFQESVNCMNYLMGTGIVKYFPSNPARGMGFNFEYVSLCGNLAVRFNDRTLDMYFEHGSNLEHKRFASFSMYESKKLIPEVISNNELHIDDSEKSSEPGIETAIAQAATMLSLPQRMDQLENKMETFLQ